VAQEFVILPAKAESKRCAGHLAGFHTGSTINGPRRIELFRHYDDLVLGHGIERSLVDSQMRQH
jgi:hypothetical protein